jgi:hypothetical protein
MTKPLSTTARGTLVSRPFWWAALETTKNAFCLENGRKATLVSSMMLIAQEVLGSFVNGLSARITQLI